MIETFLDIENNLNNKGWDIIDAGGRCPVQIQGYGPCGSPFYFRARGTHISLDVYRSDFGIEGDLPDNGFKVYEGYFYMPSWGDFEMGWLDANTAYYALMQLWNDYQSLEV